jgi:aspartyl/asparaginyl beta-hydroxylase (cupin superfamily)
MRENAPFRCLGNSSVEKCQRVLTKDVHHWIEVASRFSRRKTLPLLWCPKDLEKERIRRVKVPQEILLTHETDALLADLRRYIEGEPVRIFFAKLERGEGIIEHVDDGDIFRMSHRCHLPIVAPKGIEFQCAGVIHKPVEGEWFTLDNCSLHAVMNSATQERIHLVIDLLSPDHLHLLD